MRVGFHTEGWDHLILQALVAHVLDVPLESIDPDLIKSDGRGWRFVLQTAEAALRRFYALCHPLAVIGVDNDGDEDLDSSGRDEDPRHPRHAGHRSEAVDDCRWCQLAALVGALRPKLNWLPRKRGQSWPVVIAVPVETIEAWVLTLQAVVVPPRGRIDAERLPRRSLKMLLYGKPIATRPDVEAVALPLIASLRSEQLQEAVTHNRSLALFVEQVREARAVLGAPDLACW